MDDLIVAPATPPGDGARAIVRLAGARLAGLLPRIAAPMDGGFAAAGGPRAVAARLTADLAVDWGPLPVTILHWPGPGGPIGGPLAELQLPCSQPLVDAVVAEACRHGARLARGGEFTLRAFLSGRLDLVQAEAVLAVVDARTPDDLARALDRMAGGAGRRLEEIRAATLDLLADIEAAIDFADESTPDAVPTASATAGSRVAVRLATLESDLAVVAGELADRGAAAAVGLPRVVLVGRPNIGKSSLFNRLLAREAALVADESGTTRDWIEARLDAAARPAGTEAAACVLVDLAGIDATVESALDPLAAAAVTAAREQIARADVIVLCHDAANPLVPAEGLPAVPMISVSTRCDRGTDPLPVAAIATSSLTATGLDELRSAIARAVAALPGHAVSGTLRMSVGIAAAARHLAAASGLITSSAPGHGADEALVAGHIRAAVESLGEVTGADLGTDLLDRIFSRHCVGK